MLIKKNISAQESNETLEETVINAANAGFDMLLRMLLTLYKWRRQSVATQRKETGSHSVSVYCIKMFKQTELALIFE